jgi:RNA recognition motif-containing protein
MKLYVGNLPWSIDDKALKKLFTSYGDVEEAVLIKDKYSGRSKGFGFVTLTDDAAGQKAIAEMHQKEVGGRALTVSEAKPMVPRDNAPRYSDARGSRSSEAPMADHSAIEQDIEDSLEDDEMDTVEEAKEDAESDEPAFEEAEDAIEEFD